jgi:hypothetical protein
MSFGNGLSLEYEVLKSSEERILLEKDLLTLLQHSLHH